MKLGDKINALKPDTIIRDLNILLDFGRPAINWQGERVVTVIGYEGSVTIDALARRFLGFVPNYNDNPSLQERMEYYLLWGRIQKLYEDSIASARLYKYYVLYKESELEEQIVKSPMLRIQNEQEKQFLLSFPPEVFQKYWPGEMPLETVNGQHLNQEDQKVLGKQQEVAILWIASENMVASILNFRSPSDNSSNNPS